MVNIAALSRTTIGVWIVLMIIVFAGVSTAASVKSASVKNTVNTVVIDRCKSDLSKRLKQDEQEIKLESAEQVIWPDSALGMPEPGKIYAQAETPGYKVILRWQAQKYLYTTSTKVIKYGGPLQIWVYSLLYLKPVPNDPNMNGDLYQCSLLGTNAFRVASDVSEYYPQKDGTVVYKRRTSRSGHDLFYVDAAQPGKEKMLYQGADFCGASFDKARNQWAAIVRPKLGDKWNIALGDKEHTGSNARLLPIPEGVRPAGVDWMDDKLTISTENDDNSRSIYEMDPAEKQLKWQEIGIFESQPKNEYLINRSVTLKMNELKENGKTNLEVTLVKFTGERNVVAEIDDFTMQSCKILWPYILIWGQNSVNPSAYIIDSETCELNKSALADASNIELFTLPPHDSPAHTASK
ncbi:MAG: hypothetical protein ABFD64_06430 [Armatimonadota bacterium]